MCPGVSWVVLGNKTDLFVRNTGFKKRDSHRITYSNPDRLQVISKEPAQTCYKCEGDSPNIQKCGG